jgi:hypothetical protein
MVAAEAAKADALPPALGGYLAQQIESICEQLDEYRVLDADEHLALGREHLLQALQIVMGRENPATSQSVEPALPSHLRKVTSSLEGHTRSLEKPFSPMAMHMRPIRRSSIVELKEQKASNQKMLAKLAPSNTLRRENTLSIIQQNSDNSDSNARSGTQTFDSPGRVGRRVILRSQPSASKLGKEQPNLNPPVGISQTGEIEILRDSGGRTASGAIQCDRQERSVAALKGAVVINPNSTLYWVS